MIAGIGMDLVDLAGFREQLAQPGSVFAEGTFTSGELAEVARRPARDKTPHLAARYAAKEAFIKAWSASRIGVSPVLTRVDLREVEVVSDPHGRPALRLHGALAEAVEPSGLKAMHLTLSHDGPVAAATVILER